MIDSDFTIGFKQGQEHGKQIILEKIEDIKTEIMALEPQYPIDNNTPYISSQSVWKIINKHCGGDADETTNA